MITALKEEDAADIAKRDQCKDEYQKIASKSADLSWKIKNNKATIAELENIIEEQKEKKANTIAHIDAVDKEMFEMTAQREEENQEFLASKKLDQEAIKLLLQAKAALAKFYEENKIEARP